MLPDQLEQYRVRHGDSTLPLLQRDHDLADVQLHCEVSPHHVRAVLRPHAAGHPSGDVLVPELIQVLRPQQRLQVALCLLVLFKGNQVALLLEVPVADVANLLLGLEKCSGVVACGPIDGVRWEDVAVRGRPEVHVLLGDLPAILDDHIHCRLASPPCLHILLRKAALLAVGRQHLNDAQDLHPTHHSPDDLVEAVEVLCRMQRDHEGAGVGVRAMVSHGEEPWPVEGHARNAQMLVLQVRAPAGVLVWD
mmetsp:Transcript_174958/g.561043  ORF Transcript_174958/g.561043 Transcript_174958/m.561043 type:complete len:250 (-) Transcript_174958:556-1305(-)